MDGVLLTRMDSPLYLPSTTFVSIRLASRDDLHSLNLGIMSDGLMSANIRRDQFMAAVPNVPIPERH